MLHKHKSPNHRKTNPSHRSGWTTFVRWFAPKPTGGMTQLRQAGFAPHDRTPQGAPEPLSPEHLAAVAKAVHAIHHDKPSPTLVMDATPCNPAAPVLPPHMGVTVVEAPRTPWRPPVADNVAQDCVFPTRRELDTKQPLFREHDTTCSDASKRALQDWWTVRDPGALRLKGAASPRTQVLTVVGLDDQFGDASATKAVSR